MNFVKYMVVITLLCDFNMHDPFLSFLQSSFLQQRISSIFTKWLEERDAIESPGFHKILPENSDSSSRYVYICSHKMH